MIRPLLLILLPSRCFHQGYCIIFEEGMQHIMDGVALRKKTYNKRQTASGKRLWKAAHANNRETTKLCELLPARRRPRIYRSRERWQCN